MEAPARPADAVLPGQCGAVRDCGAASKAPMDHAADSNGHADCRDRSRSLVIRRKGLTMSKRLFLLLLFVLSGCCSVVPAPPRAGAAATEPVVDDAYAPPRPGATAHYDRMFLELFGYDLKLNFGIAYQQSLGGRPGEQGPELLLLVQRIPQGTLGPVTARFVYPKQGKPLFVQLAALPGGLSYEEAKSRVEVTNLELHEGTCPALRELWAAVPAINYTPGEWSHQFPHDALSEVTVRSLSNHLVLVCRAGCGGFSYWADDAFKQMKRCAGI
jgi:hypothetical protein